MPYLMSDYSECLAQPADTEFNAACLAVCETLFPDGFDVVSSAPNTWEDLFDHYQRTGRIVVTDAPDPLTVFGDQSNPDHHHTYAAFRAWHDWTHLFTGGQFTPTGEAIVARAQECALAVRFGEDKAKRWMQLIHDEIIVNNFGVDGPDEAHMTLA